MSHDTSAPPKDTGPTADPVKIVGIKRLHTDAPSSPGFPNVYVRRKVDNEHSKLNPSHELKGTGKDKTIEQDEQKNVRYDQANKQEVASPIIESSPSGGLVLTELASPNVKSGGLAATELTSPIIESGGLVPTELASPNVKSGGLAPTKLVSPIVESGGLVPTELASPIVESGGLVPTELTSPVVESGGLVPSESPEKTNTETVPCFERLETVSEKNKPLVTSGNETPTASGTTVQDDSHRLSSQNQYWSERYNRLRTYLENCDRSTQEGYMRMLRSMSAPERSMNAVELEKRAIHLLVEEGKELQRMKALNVLGKVSPNGPSKQAQAPLQRECRK